jgi:hypothetical protein
LKKEPLSTNERNEMKKTIATILLAAFAASTFACSPWGWVLVSSRYFGSGGEMLCTYQKDGVQLSLVVKGFCPIHPC